MIDLIKAFEITGKRAKRKWKILWFHGMLSTKIWKLYVTKYSDFSLAFGKGWVFLLAAALLQYYWGCQNASIYTKSIRCAGYFLERKPCLSIFSSFEVGLAWSRSRSGGGFEKEGYWGRVGSQARGVCVGRAASDTGSLVVGWIAIFTAHLRGFNWSLQARDSVSEDVVSSGPVLQGFRSHTSSSLIFKWFELMTLIQTDKGGKWKC